MSNLSSVKPNGAGSRVGSGPRWCICMSDNMLHRFVSDRTRVGKVPIASCDRGLQVDDLKAAGALSCSYVIGAHRTGSQRIILAQPCMHHAPSRGCCRALSSVSDYTPTPSIHCTRGFAAWCALREGTVYHVPEVPHCTPTVRPTLSFHGHTASHISTGGGGRRVTTAVCGTSSSTKSFTEAPGRVHTGVRKLISCSSRCPWSSQSCQRCP